MRTVIKLLKQELREWKQQYDYERRYWKGEEKCRDARKSLRVHKNHIAELEKAIKILSSNERESDRKHSKAKEFCDSPELNCGKRDNRGLCMVSRCVLLP